MQLDVTIINVALPRIGADLGTGIAGLQWVVDAYPLVFATLLLTAGYLGDFFGAKRIYLGGLAVFAAASLGCRLTATMGGLIAARIVQGAGAAAMMPASLTLLNHAVRYDARLRAWAVGWWAAAATTAITAGPVLGGLIVGVASWRWIFLVSLPISVIGAALTLRVRETKPADSTGGFDLPGQILGIAALGARVGADRSQAAWSRPPARDRGLRARACRNERLHQSGAAGHDADAAVVPVPLPRLRHLRGVRRGGQHHLYRAALRAEPLFTDRARLRRSPSRRPADRIAFR